MTISVVIVPFFDMLEAKDNKSQFGSKLDIGFSEIANCGSHLKNITTFVVYSDSL